MQYTGIHVCAGGKMTDGGQVIPAISRRSNQLQFCTYSHTEQQGNKTVKPYSIWLDVVARRSLSVSRHVPVLYVHHNNLHLNILYVLPYESISFTLL
jgi:hypothetical protein